MQLLLLLEESAQPANCTGFGPGVRLDLLGLRTSRVLCFGMARHDQ